MLDMSSFSTPHVRPIKRQTIKPTPRSKTQPILDRRRTIVTRFANALQIIPIKEQPHITFVRPDMVNDRRRRDPTHLLTVPA